MHKLTAVHERHALNRKNSSFPEYVTHNIGEPKYRTARTSNSKEPQQKYRLGRVSFKKRGEGGLNRFNGYPTSPSASAMAQNI